MEPPDGLRGPAAATSSGLRDICPLEASMAPSSSSLDQTLLDALRRQRAELRGSMSALEIALAGPAPSDPVRWSERVHVALVEMSADLREHIEVTEGPAGLYVDVLATAPRLAGAVSRLTREHVQISDLVDDLLSRVGTPGNEDTEKVRELGTTLLGLLVRHRQQGSDLVYEAYEFDVGGET
jgi:hypothetical protein